MSRSLKKGPFIDFKLEKRVLEMNQSNKKTGNQNLVATLDDIS
jgi:ribosomal protein S19